MLLNLFNHMMNWDFAQWAAFGAHVIAISSVLHTVLPPWEAFCDFPRLQKAYKLFIYLLGWVAINFRSRIWSGISTQDGTAQSVLGAVNCNNVDTIPVSKPVSANGR